MPRSLGRGNSPRPRRAATGDRTLCLIRANDEEHAADDGEREGPCRRGDCDSEAGDRANEVAHLDEADSTHDHDSLLRAGVESTDGGRLKGRVTGKNDRAGHPDRYICSVERANDDALEQPMNRDRSEG